MGRPRILPCSRCLEPVTKTVTGANPAVFCDACRAARREERRKRVATTCSTCGVVFTLDGRQGLERARQPRTYCSAECRHAAMSTAASRYAKIRAPESSIRMRERNPMHTPGVKERVAASRRATGDWAPSVRGGNGRGPTEPQKKLLDALGAGWGVELAIPTSLPRGSGYPTAYKVDLALPSAKMAVEVDGHTHNSPRQRALDRKKDECLRGLGWRVWRFSNRAAMDDTEGCVRTVTSTT